MNADRVFHQKFGNGNVTAIDIKGLMSDSSNMHPAIRLAGSNG